VTIVDFAEISKADAIAAVHAASWVQYRSELATCGHRGCEDHPGGVQRIHSMLGGFGADWDVDDVVLFIETAERCGWLEGSFLGHQLAVVGADGRRMRFEANRPTGDAA
jgi:hypothetical protein